MKHVFVGFSTLLLGLILLAGCGQKCFYGKLELVYLDKVTDEKDKRPITDYKILIDQQSVAVTAQPDGTFQICDLKKKKHPDRVLIMLDGRKLPSAQTFKERGNIKDPWLIRAPGPIRGSDGGIDTSWIQPETGDIKPKPGS